MYDCQPNFEFHFQWIAISVLQKVQICFISVKHVFIVCSRLFYLIEHFCHDNVVYSLHIGPDRITNWKGTKTISLPWYHLQNIFLYNFISCFIRYKWDAFCFFASTNLHVGILYNYMYSFGRCFYTEIFTNEEVLIHRHAHGKVWVIGQKGSSLTHT